MRKLFALISLFGWMNVYAQNDGAEPKHISMDSLFREKENQSIGRSFPEFKANFNKHNITKDSLKGKVVFINFWFEKCPPCIAELDALNALYKQFSVNKDFVFLSFTYETPANIMRLKKKFNMHYPVASVNSQECYRLNQNNGFPTSIILDKNGVIRSLLTGGNTDKKIASATIVERAYPVINEELTK